MVVKRTKTHPRDEGAVQRESYQHLEFRTGSWHEEPFLRGRNMTVGHLISGMRANGFTVQEAAENYDLPMAQVEEALRYCQLHPDAVERDRAEERRRIEDAATFVGSTALHR